MAARPVEWVLVIHYGTSAHKAAYGRLASGGYTKDYIQLYQGEEFVQAAAQMLSVPATENGAVPLTYRWPLGSAPGDFVFQSADRPHLKWETARGAPPPWRMAATPSDATPETIPGDPGHTKAEDANKEFSQIAHRGAGQPYLLAIKLKDETRVLHLRTYLGKPSDAFKWADLGLTPDEVQVLAARTSQSRALAWSLLASGGVLPSGPVEQAVRQLAKTKNPMSMLDSLDADIGRALSDYLRQPAGGLFFDPSRNHDAWVRPTPLPMALLESINDLQRGLDARFPPIPQGDAAAERIASDPNEVEEFKQKMTAGDFAVADTMATVKTRGSAQRAFAAAVKANYGNRCALTGLATNDFLVASHIVPWSEDQTIRLDPSNGICLSLLVDRAFEKGYLTIDDDLTVRVNEERVGTDEELRKMLLPFQGKALRVPENNPPGTEYLQRRRVLINLDS